ncbi:3-phenylpropionate MFS transporter [Kingella negevensis]|uniref:3-phenylpropionate MFS transporter n=1 Tax=Kingella negevensis TaxID=1522312 RepID=UPI00254C0A05|nr:3-phenylpropionate MFS transporter [Kingella negevensis]MDK4679558.1 3-phenylpropionate MFS transporter [Kingella negevensis]MDK4682724.1 3-phenylpropionate MFS transporter [Kingella negevensis]MDK4685469.1 3-phenylpropionate MFS transporter [Kingella negevensis]MDK4690921.1 3-phenylpropionate MFS transporter [Kingella negevensis]MDK4693932.1 3-phenylpropionate MFS transporter [Kingella negevensis]
MKSLPPKVSAFAWLSMNFFGFYSAFGVIQPFFPLWLKSHAYSELFIAAVMSSAYLFRFAGGLLLSKCVKNIHWLLNVIRFATFGSLCALIAVGASVGNHWALVLLVWVFFLFNGGVMPLNETAASAWQKQITLDYGRARLSGSVAYIIGAMLSGSVAEHFGASQLIYLMMGFTALQFIMQWAKPNPALVQKETQHSEASKSFLAIFRQPEVKQMLIAVSLIQGSHAAYYTYGAIYWKTQGITEQQISWLWSVSVVAEIVLFFFSKRLIGGASITRLMQASALIAGSRWLLMTVTADPTMLMLVQILHAGTFSLSHFAMVKFIVQQPESDMAKLQALYIGLGSCVAIAGLTLVSGGLYQLHPLLAFGAMGLVGLAALRFVPKVVEVK